MLDLKRALTRDDPPAPSNRRFTPPSQRGGPTLNRADGPSRVGQEEIDMSFQGETVLVTGTRA